MIEIPIEINDIVLGGKFLNKKIKVKKIGKNSKGDWQLNDKPLLRFRIPKKESIEESQKHIMKMIDEVFGKIEPYDLRYKNILKEGKGIVRSFNANKKISSNSQVKEIGFDSLPEEVQEDIAGNVQDNDEFLSNNGWSSSEYNPGDFADMALINKVPELKLKMYRVSTEKMYKEIIEQRGLEGLKKNDIAVKNLMDVLLHKKDLDPIIIKNGQFFDGGHRVAAYYYIGKKTIPAIDIQPVFEIDWKKELG